MTDITLLDGGMGQELVRRSGDRPTPLWSTQVMIDHPGLVREVHRDFTAAGATVATVNSYAIHRDRLADTPLEGRFEELHAAALNEAKGTAPRLAGSIGPLRASYRPDLHPPRDIAVEAFAEIARLIGPECDLMLCETVASIAHARDVLEGARAAGKPIWLAVTVQDRDGSKLRSGEPVADVLEVAQGAEALLINCSTPEVIPTALAQLDGATVPIGAYANGFERISEGFLGDKPTVDALRMRWDFTPERYADHVMAWVDAGASIVGGCCEVSPDHIAEIARRLRAAGHTIV